MAGARVLVVDEDARSAKELCGWLRAAGYAASYAQDSQEGLQQFLRHKPDLMVAEVFMRRMDGLELCRRIRALSSLPFLFLSAQTKEEGKVAALLAGGDDYLTKPPGRGEFLARVAAALRRAPPVRSGETPAVYTDPFLTVNLDRHEVYARGSLVHLTPIEYRLLVHLVERAGQVVSRDHLLDAVWGPEFEEAGAVKWHVGHLRRKLGDDPKAPEIIVNTRGAGYRYEQPAG